MMQLQHIANTRIRPAFWAVALLCLCSINISAQDIHFTQFFTNPLVLNPAQTGNYNGNYRVGFNFKAQWPWAINGVTYNYHTESPYADISFGEKAIKVGWMGLGFNFVNDQAGDGMLTYRRFSLSYAYHQAFDKEHRYILSAGLQVSYVIRSVDFTKFYFNNQWVEDDGFNTSINSHEPWETQNFSLVDLGAGLNFSGQIHEQVRIKAGFTMLHINRPKHSFYNGSERLGFRYQANAGVEYKITDRVLLQADAYYGYEKKASEITLGALVGYGLYSGRNKRVNNMFYLGAYYRVKDALAPMAGYSFKQTRLLLSYDVTLSKLIRPAKANGGPEISLVHVGSFKRTFNGKKEYCPQF